MMFPEHILPLILAFGNGGGGGGSDGRGGNGLRGPVLALLFYAVTTLLRNKRATDAARRTWGAARRSFVRIVTRNRFFRRLILPLLCFLSSLFLDIAGNGTRRPPCCRRDLRAISVYRLGTLWDFRAPAEFEPVLCDISRRVMEQASSARHDEGGGSRKRAGDAVRVVDVQVGYSKMTPCAFSVASSSSSSSLSTPGSAIGGSAAAAADDDDGDDDEEVDTDVDYEEADECSAIGRSVSLSSSSSSSSSSGALRARLLFSSTNVEQETGGGGQPGGSTTFTAETCTVRLLGDTYAEIEDYLRACAKRHALETMRRSYEDPKMFVLEHVTDDDRHGLDLRYITYDLDYTETFDNKFFTGKEELRALGRNFAASREKHRALGIAHTLGVCLHGRPGTGKTSGIKAFAADRSAVLGGVPVHIIIVNVALVTNVRVLREVLLGDYINGTYVPHDRRVYVLEEVDCSDWRHITCSRSLLLGNCSEDHANGNDQGGDEDRPLPRPHCRISSRPLPRLLGGRRGGEKARGSSSSSSRRAVAKSKIDEDEDDENAMEAEGSGGDRRQRQRQQLSAKDFPLTLGQLLELLDGMIKRDGHVIFMTTNRVHEIDEALLRPGRFDAVLELKELPKEDVARMHAQWFDGDALPDRVYRRMPDRAFTQADVGRMFSQGRETAWRMLLEKGKGKEEEAEEDGAVRSHPLSPSAFVGDD